MKYSRVLQAVSPDLILDWINFHDYQKLGLIIQYEIHFGGGGGDDCVYQYHADSVVSEKGRYKCIIKSLLIAIGAISSVL